MIHQSAAKLQLCFQPPVPIHGIVFRLAARQDLKMLWQNCYADTHWPHFKDHYQYLLRWQQEDRCVILIAETSPDTAADGIPEIIGSGQLIYRLDQGEIAELIVCEPFRKQGIGTAVIQILTAIARERHLRLLEIGVELENHHALRLYRQLGFSNERPLTLPNAVEALILSKFIYSGGTE